MLAMLAGGAGAAEQWVTDPHSGCKVADAYPVPGRTVVWSGACAGGLAVGAGTAQWWVGDRLDATQTGSFVAGRAEGPGEVVWTDGRRYSGGFHDGVAQGKGSFVWPDGRRYEGDWDGGYRTGQGVRTFKNGDRFIGRFDHNRPVGDG